MGVFDVTIEAGANLITSVVGAAVEGVVNIAQSVAATDVGTIVIVAVILIIAKKSYDKMASEKKK